MHVSSSRQPPFYVATADDVALSKVHPERRGSGSNSSGADATVSCNKKRSRSQCGSFDLTDLVHASQEVEDSISSPIVLFPSLENSVVDLDSSIEAEAEDESVISDIEDFNTTTAAMPSRKRHCRGLVRCQRSYDLSSMVDMTNGTESTTTMFTERRGSAGSMA